MAGKFKAQALNLIVTFPSCLSPAGHWRASPAPNDHFHLEDGMAPAVCFPVIGEKRNSSATTNRRPLLVPLARTLSHGHACYEETRKTMVLLAVGHFAALN